jgi:hypothetical protein
MLDQTLIEKIRTLPPERQEEVEDFVDFLKARDQGRFLSNASAGIIVCQRSTWARSTSGYVSRLSGTMARRYRLAAVSPTRFAES